MSNLLQISSVVPEVKNGEIVITARWKETKDKPLNPNNRNRSVILPANIWSGEFSVSHEDSDTAKQLRLVMLESINDLAKSYLSSICEESNMLRTQVPLEHFQLSSLLTWSAEQAALSGRLNGDEIKSWISQSVTIKQVHEVHGEKIAAALGEQFVKLASPNHGLTPEKADKILTNLWKPEDCDTTTGLRVQMRLTAISKKAEQTANVLDSIL